MGQKSSGTRLNRQMDAMLREIGKLRRAMQHMQELPRQLENALIEIQELKQILEDRRPSHPEYLPPRHPAPGPPAPNPLGGFGNFFQNMDIGEIIKLLNNPLVQDLLKNFFKR